MDAEERKLARARLEAQHDILRVLAESNTVAAATPRFLRVLCESARVDFGALWRLDRQAGVLRCIETWAPPDAELLDFEAQSRAATLASGQGLPGQVWAQGQLAWTVDLGSDAESARAAAARRRGLRGSIALPIVFSGRFFGVLEFCSRTAAAAA
jgi:GAF domain-containing protein